MSEIIECAGRRFVALRKTDGRLFPIGDRGYHAAAPFCGVALCSAEPGTRSWWADAPVEHMIPQSACGVLIKLRNLVCNWSEPSRPVTEGAFFFDNLSTVLCDLGGDR
jgi:hypothetical protein